MDEALAQKLSRQLKILNFFLIFFTIIFMAMFIIASLFAYATYKEVRDAKNSLNSLQTKAEDSLDVKSQLCGTSSGSLKSLLRSQSDICN